MTDYVYVEPIDPTDIVACYNMSKEHQYTSRSGALGAVRKEGARLRGA